MFCNSPIWPQPDQAKPHNPAQATPVGLTPARFGLFRVRSPLLTESLLFSLPGGTEMVHFPPFASTGLCIQPAMTGYCPAGLPHSEIPGSKPVCGSPRLFAAYRVLLRLSAPRHPPCTLSSLTKLELTTLNPANPIASNPIQLSMNPRISGIHAYFALRKATAHSRHPPAQPND